MQLVTLTTIKEDAKLYADMRAGGSANFISSAQLDRLVNQVCKAHYDLCVQARPELYAIELICTLDTGKPTSVGAYTVGKRVFVPLPTCPPFYMLLGVEIMWADDDIEPVPEVRAADSHFYERLTYGRYNTKGYVFGASPQAEPGEGFYLVPGALDGSRLRIRYIPTFQDLGANNCKDQPNNDFNAVNGWDKLVALGVAMEMMAIQGRDTTDLQPMYSAEYERIKSMATERNAQEKRRVRDVEGDRPTYGWDGGYVVGPR